MIITLKLKLLRDEEYNTRLKDNPRYEIARQFREIADKIENGEFKGECSDRFGKKVGLWNI